MSKKQIHIFLYHIDLGGVEKAAVNFSNELTNLGHQVYLHPIYKCKVEKFTLNSKVEVVPFMKFYVKGMDRLIKLFPPQTLYRMMMFSYRNQKVDVEIAFQADLPATIVSTSKRNSLKLVWIHGIGMNFTDAYNKFDKMIFVGNDIKKHYINSVPELKKLKHQVFFNPIETNKIIKLSEEPIENKCKDDIFTFISVGRLSKEKQFDRLILSFSELINNSKNNLKTNLIIVGSGSEKDFLENKIKELGMEQYVSLLGYQKNPYKYLGNSDCYVCSSSYEGFNISMTEAGVLGIPIISTEVYGAKEFLGEKNEYGIVVNDSIHELQKAMEFMIIKSNHKKFSKAIQERTQSFYGENRIAKLIELLEYQN